MSAALDAARDLFVGRFYRRTPPEDIDGRSAESLRRAAERMFAFMRERRPGSDKLRVYDPDPKRDGWSSPRTVIDLVTDDRPFIVDSLTAELNAREIPIRFVAHPTWRARRDASGALRELREPGAAAAPDTGVESTVRIEVRRQDSADSAALAARLAHVLEDVRRAVADWGAMRGALDAAVRELAETAPAHPDRGEIAAFLRWIADRHFTFVGYRRYDLAQGAGGEPLLKGVPGAALGVMSRAEERENLRAARGRPLPAAMRARLADANPLIVGKSARRSTVHRQTHMDSIEIKRRGAGGGVVGVHRFLGLYTSSAYNAPLADIPLLRRKAARVAERAGFAPGGHDGKAFLHILETFPRDELFQFDDDALLDTALGVLHLHERPRTRLFVRRDGFGWAVSCLVFVPAERYEAGLRRAVAPILEDAFSGVCRAFHTHVGDAPVARLHVVLSTTPAGPPPPRAAAVEARLAAALRRWEDDLRDELAAIHDEHRAAALERRYRAAFPAGYRDRVPARAAVRDIDRVEEARADGLALELRRPPGAPADSARFRIFSRGEQLALSDVLPTLENMGLRVADEFPHRVAGAGGGADVWLHDLGVAGRGGAAIDAEGAGPRFREAFARIRAGDAEDDGFNALVLAAGLDWREAAALRAYARLLRQAGIPFSHDYMARTLAANPEIARGLTALFAARFDPDGHDPDRAAAAAAAVRAALESTASLDEDRIARRFLNAVESTLRTNFYRRGADGAPRAHMAFKLDSARLAELPPPRPWVEVFVCGPRVEGAHLRGGRVARGGLRWSDRLEDYRTEVLGLMKAQMTKNAVIVPVGAKGGFVVKRPPQDGGRGALRAEGIACYRAFVSALLDVADNVVDGAVVPPPGVVRHDGDDPYLVVAADKGTAAFSDIANEIADRYGFWLGDAFASGGSTGYDHKRLGVTARGAWESVRRHFRDRDVDADAAPLSVVGIGDMSGDVFGNGMLLSRNIRLVGAFDHRCVFVDPDPDPAAAFAERRRLFALERSGWADYDRRAISAGGGVFDRGAKSVALTPEIKRVLAVGADSLTPDELVSALLRAPVDLLWNGGVGTFVKAAGETHADSGDRANDPVRIDARELRCKVVAEGGNLGFTQRARVEAARAGVRLNRDAIDNSAGVDCSDREVNIKILLNDAVAAGALDRADRDPLLAEMAGEVTRRCLRGARLQALGIGVVESLGADRLDLQQRAIQELERAGRLDRRVEDLPDDEAIEALRAAGIGLSRPEIAVLHAHAKAALYDDLLDSGLPDDPFLAGELEDYFPAVLAARLGPRIRRHGLRREIVATALANAVVDRAGPAFVTMAREETGAAAADVVRAFAAARAAFDMPRLWADWEELDSRIPAPERTAAAAALRGPMEHAALWLLRNRPRPLDCAAAAAPLGAGVSALAAGLDRVLPGDLGARVAADARSLRERGASEPLAVAVAAAGPLHSACWIVDAADRTGRGAVETGRLFFRVGRRLGLDWLRDRAQRFAPAGLWRRRAAAAIVDDLHARQAALTVRAAAADGGLDGWAAENRALLDRHARLLEDLRAQPECDLAMLSVAARRLREFAPE